MIVASCRDITKVYTSGKVTVEALQGITCDFYSGFNLLVGKSGSGKSTLLNVLGLLDNPSSGVVEVAGAETTKMTGKRATIFRRQRVGFIFQSFSLIPTLNVFDNVSYPLASNKDVRDTEKRNRVAEMLQAVDLEGYEKRMPRTLSGGQQQRVAIARALINRPDLILADEPTASLDSNTSGRVLDLLTDLAEERKAAIILASHDFNVIQRISRVVELKDGKIVRSTGADE